LSGEHPQDGRRNRQDMAFHCSRHRRLAAAACIHTQSIQGAGAAQGQTDSGVL